MELTELEFLAIERIKAYLKTRELDKGVDYDWIHAYGRKDGMYVLRAHDVRTLLNLVDYGEH